MYLVIVGAVLFLLAVICVAGYCCLCAAGREDEWIRRQENRK